MSTIQKYKGLSKVKPEGLVLIPKEIRDTMGITPGSPISIEYDNGRFIVTALPEQIEMEVGSHVAVNENGMPTYRNVNTHKNFPIVD